MKNCKEEKCISNKDGVCVGNWAECPLGRPVADNYLVKMCSILVIILVLLVYGFHNNITKLQPEAEAVVPVSVEEPAPEVKHGQYTILDYTKGGWVNRLYVTDYYITDHIIYYKSREHQDEYMEVLLDDCLPQPGWIENPEELMKYGYWEYTEEEDSNEQM